MFSVLLMHSAFINVFRCFQCVRFFWYNKIYDIVFDMFVEPWKCIFPCSVFPGFYHQNSCGGLSFLLERLGPFDVFDDNDDTELDRRLFFAKRRKSEAIFWSRIRSTVRFMMMVLPTWKNKKKFLVKKDLNSIQRF